LHSSAKLTCLGARSAVFTINKSSHTHFKSVAGWVAGDPAEAVFHCGDRAEWGRKSKHSRCRSCFCLAWAKQPVACGPRCLPDLKSNAPNCAAGQGVRNAGTVRFSDLAGLASRPRPKKGSLDSSSRRPGSRPASPGNGVSQARLRARPRWHLPSSSYQRRRVACELQQVAGPAWRPPALWIPRASNVVMQGECDRASSRWGPVIRRGPGNRRLAGAFALFDFPHPSRPASKFRMKSRIARSAATSLSRTARRPRQKLERDCAKATHPSQEAASAATRTGASSSRCSGYEQAASSLPP